MKYIKRFMAWTLDRYGDCFPDKLYLYLTFRRKLGYFPNLRAPLTFNEKIQWLKLYDRNPSYPEYVDKHGVKELVSRKIGAQYIIPTLGTWDKFEDIDFDLLPDKFVLKCCHDSGSAVVCRDKETFDYDKANKKLSKALAYNYYSFGREWVYKKIPPKILAEPYIEDEYGELRDYKFLCFNGVVKYFAVHFNRFTGHRANYYNRDCKIQEFGDADYPPDFSREIVIPNNIDQMKLLAEKLAENIPFVRVDFYCVQRKIYFGEMTFYPDCGFAPFTPESYDRILGDELTLPNVKLVTK